MFRQKSLHETWCMSRCMLWWSCQSPVAHSCRFLNHPNSFHGGMFICLMRNLMQICCSTQSIILNVTATQYTCSLNDVYPRPPHWLIQWSRHCSHMHIPVHSPWLPGYIDVAQTILVILTMAGLFLDRPYRMYFISCALHTHNSKLTFAHTVYIFT